MSNFYLGAVIGTSILFGIYQNSVLAGCFLAALLLTLDILWMKNT